MYAIIGYPLLTTFSPGYFREKFDRLGIDETYQKFPLEQIADITSLIASHPELKGLNVTIPYKQAVIPFLDRLDATAEQVGAVNTIKVEHGKLTGYNTDVTGFANSLKPLLRPQHDQALILGTGGASKAVACALGQSGIAFKFVSRAAGEGPLSYDDLDEGVIASHPLIINTTPLGMKPYEGMLPPIPYGGIGPEHLLYDLIYHPEVTPFLQRGKEQGATIKNGYEMLTGQAEAAWDIWNNALT